MAVRVMPRVGPFVFMRVPRTTGWFSTLLAVTLVIGIVWPIQALVIMFQLMTYAVVSLHHVLARQAARRV